MTKSQLKVLEDLKFEIEKTRLEIELVKARKELDSVSQVETKQADPPKPIPRLETEDIPRAQRELLEIEAERAQIEEELKESTAQVANLKAMRKQQKTKEARASVEAQLNEAVERNVSIYSTLKLLRKEIAERRRRLQEVDALIDS